MSKSKRSMTWSGTASRVAAVAGGGLLATLAGLTARYSWHQKRIERSRLTDIAPRLDSIDKVDELSIVPVVERLAPSDGRGLADAQAAPRNETTTTPPARPNKSAGTSRRGDGPATSHTNQARLKPAPHTVSPNAARQTPAARAPPNTNEDAPERY
jgi:hypothetical protein